MYAMEYDLVCQLEPSTKDFSPSTRWPVVVRANRHSPNSSTSSQPFSLSCMHFSLLDLEVSVESRSWRSGWLRDVWRGGMQSDEESAAG